MNSTSSYLEDDSNPIFIYIMLIIELLNCMISAVTSYKLGHFQFKTDHIKCCCFEFDGIDIEVSDSDSEVKK